MKQRAALKTNLWGKAESLLAATLPQQHVVRQCREREVLNLMVINDINTNILMLNTLDAYWETSIVSALDA